MCIGTDMVLGRDKERSTPPVKAFILFDERNCDGLVIDTFTSVAQLLSRLPALF